MLLKLPLEITLNIASYLEFKDKLNLKTTCRKLNDQITKAVLFEELNIRQLTRETKTIADVKKAINCVIQKMINDQFDGSMVKVLHLDSDALSDSNYSQLSDLFPNVNRFITYNQSRGQMSGNPRNTRAVKNQLKKWRNTIKYINDTYDWKVILDDVWHSKYPHLTKLVLKDVYDKLKECVGKKPRCSLFTNAPSLTSLYMDDPNLNLEILEAIHAGFPLLQSLRFLRPHFQLEKNDTLPLSVAPAHHMTRLELCYSTRLYKNGVIFEYMLKKYPNLVDLHYSVSPEHDYHFKTVDEFQEHNYPGYSKGGSDSDEDDNSKGYEEAVSAHIARCEARYRIYSALEAKFFSNLPKSMRRLTININNKANAIAALSKSDAKITKLNLVNPHTIHCRRKTFEWYSKECTDKDILEHFRNLTSLRTLKITIDPTLQTFMPEFVSSSITRLYIGFSKGDFGIEWILSMFPLLEELYIGKGLDVYLIDSEKNGRCDVYKGGDDGVIRPSREYPKLRVLCIKRHTTHPKLFEFLTKSAPNLEELELEICLRDESQKILRKFDFSSWSLSRCSLSFGRSRPSSSVCCTLSIQNIARKFEINTADKTLSLIDRTSKNRQVEIIFSHVQKLKLFKSSVMTIGDTICIEL